MFLKFVTTIAAVLLITQSQAANYYFSASGNDAYTSTQAQNKATPWQTINKLNTYFVNIKAGDSILFKSGETFLGPMQIIKSGIAGKPIVIGAYGTGNKPIITGMSPASGWTSVGGGVFEGTCPLGTASTANVVLLNGAAKPLGRYPNINTADSGYLNVASHLGGSQITSTQLNTALNWAGAEVVIRKNHWTLDRAIISSNTANTINYATSTTIPLDNFGFFIQNSPLTLDQPGEWYYNPVTKKVRMYFGASMPPGAVVQVASSDNAIYSKNNNYVTIQGIAFNGSNTIEVELWNVNNYVIQNCTFKYGGITALDATNSNYVSILNNIVDSCNNSGLYIASGNHGTISNNTVKHISLIPGMGQTGSAGIYASGIGHVITNNDIEYTGSSAISFRGDSAIVKNNFLNYFSMTRDDSGGIYTGGVSITDTTQFNHGRQITGNIILNGQRATDGTSGTFIGCTVGIYCDDNSSNINITGNTVSGCPGGIKLHNPQNITVTGNTFYNNDVQVISSHDQTYLTAKNTVFTNNIAFSKTISQNIFYFISNANDYGRLGTFSNNYYSNYIDNTFPFNVNFIAMSLPMWQATYNKDANSILATMIPYYTFGKTAKRDKFNNGAFNKNITGATSYSVNGNYKVQWQVKLDAGSLQSYFSFISGSKSNGAAINFPIGTINTANKYMVKFSMKGAKRSERMWATLRNAAAPYNIISETQYAVIDTGRTENTFVFNPTTTVPSATLVFSLENEDNTIWFDNVGVFQTVATINNPDDYILFSYNNTTKNQTVTLAGKYVDVKSKLYSGSTTLAPFTSLILLKNPDTIASAPPIVYTVPDTLKNVIAVSSGQKTVGVGVYPNPASDFIKLNFNDMNVKDLNIKLLNSSGDVILNQNVQVNDSSYQLNFGAKPVPGCYFIQLRGTGINQTSKVIII